VTGFGPLLTTRSTAASGRSVVPAFGLLAMTWPSGTVSDQRSFVVP
jgi:hypothetical protein